MYGVYWISSAIVHSSVCRNVDHVRLLAQRNSFWLLFVSNVLYLASSCGLTSWRGFTSMHEERVGGRRERGGGGDLL